jgi:phage-related minor tail protein
MKKSIFRAQGGPVDAGKPYLVGEKGPEIIIPSFRW